MSTDDQLALGDIPGLGPVRRQALAEAGIGPGLVRVSVGLEHRDDLIADFDRALRTLTRA